jgi:CrcB protein
LPTTAGCGLTGVVIQFALVAVGGVVGAVGRYWLAGIVQRASGADFPAGTLAVNVIGCFLLGLIMVLSLERGLIGPNLRLCLAVGLCGGFTTMSTFSYETLMLLRDGQIGLAAGNVFASVAAGLAAMWLGGTIGRVL